MRTRGEGAMSSHDLVMRPEVRIGGAFALTDHFGRAVTDRDFVGKVAVLFFGFTNCKVVCPENLAKLSRVHDQLAGERRAPAMLYVTVDPERDTPERMRTFLARFPAFIGLTGTRDQIDAVKRAFKVFAAREDADADENYDVPHTAMTFVLGADGGYLTHFGEGANVDTIVARLRSLIQPTTVSDNQ